MSFYRLVWEPGQRIPVHDHGTWGGGGVVKEQLEEQSCMQFDPDQIADRHDGIKLQRESLVYSTCSYHLALIPVPKIWEYQSSDKYCSWAVTNTGLTFDSVQQCKL